MSDLLQAAVGRLRGWSSGLPEGSAQRLRALMAPRSSGAVEVDRFRRVAQPVGDLPIWLAADVDAPAGAVDAGIDAALAGYLYVGLRDAAIDSEDGAGTSAPPDDERLTHRLFTRHAAALGRAANDAALWDLFDRVWQEHATAVMLHRALRRADASIEPSAQLDASARRARPIVLPGAAVLWAAGQGAEADRLVALVEHTTRAAQLFDDLVDARDDLAAGSMTSVVRRLDGAQGAAALNLALATGRGEAVLDDAISELITARHIARSSDWMTLDRGLAREIERIGAFRRRIDDVLATLMSGLQPTTKETTAWAST